jgi:alanine racemase
MTSPSPEAATRPVLATIDLGAISHNIELIRERAQRPVRLIVPVKANAYGHGVESVGLHLERLGVDALATANVTEALSLRRAGARLPILMYASQLPAGIPYLLEHDLTPTIADRAGLEAAAAASGGAPVAVHVEVDGGFGRLGVRFDEATDFIRAVLAEPRLKLEGAYTHLPFGDDAGRLWAQRRLAAFTALVRRVEAEHGITIEFAQAAASGALLSDLPDELNTVAPGHLVYGISPLTVVSAEAFGFRRALSCLTAPLIHSGQRETGDDLADGRASRAQRTAVILFGIDNGSRFAAGACVLVRGQRCPVLSVTAEYTVVDISALPSASLGDTATIIGHDASEEITLDDVATQQDVSAGYWMMGLRRVPYLHLTHGAAWLDRST